MCRIGRNDQRRNIPTLKKRGKIFNGAGIGIIACEHIKVKQNGSEYRTGIFVLSERMQNTGIDQNNITLFDVVMFKVDTFFDLAVLKIYNFHFIMPMHRKGRIKIRQYGFAHHIRKKKVTFLSRFL